MRAVLGNDEGIRCVLHQIDLAVCDVTGKKLKSKGAEQRDRAEVAQLASNPALAAHGVKQLRNYSDRIANVYTVVSKRLRALQVLAEMQIENNVPRDRVVTLKYEGATRWLSGLRMWRSFLALRNYVVQMKRMKARESDVETLVPPDLDTLSDDEAADVVDIVRVFERIENVMLLLQGEQGSIAAIKSKTLESMHRDLVSIGATKRIDTKLICTAAADVAGALATSIDVRMSSTWRSANYLHGATLLDITTTNDVPESLLFDVLNIVTVVSFQIADEVFSVEDVDEAIPGRRNDLRKLVDDMRGKRDDFVQQHADSNDVGLVFWREVANGNVKLSTTARTAFTWFSRAIRAFATISPSEAAAERAFSCAKFVLDGRDSLRDSLLERGVVLRSYLQRRCTTKEAWTALTKQFAAAVHAKRQERKLKKQ